MFEMGSSTDDTPTLFTEPGTGRTYYREWAWISTPSGGYEGRVKVYLDEEWGLAS